MLNLMQDYECTMRVLCVYHARTSSLGGEGDTLQRVKINRKNMMGNIRGVFVCLCAASARIEGII